MSNKELWQEQAHKMGGEDLVGIITEIRDGIKEIKGAFPAGDYEGHRRYHETIIELLAEKRRLRIAITEKALSALVWMAICWMGAALWHELIEQIWSRK